MGEGCTRSVCGDSLETVAAILFYFRAETVQFYRCFPFIYILSGLQAPFYPEQEFFHGYPVLDMYPAHGVHLKFVLDGFSVLDGTCRFSQFHSGGQEIVIKLVVE